MIDLDFLLKSAHICKKWNILCNLRTITQEKGKKECTFWALPVCYIYFCIWKLSKFIFIGSPLWSILVCKIPKFWRWKLWDQNFVQIQEIYTFRKVEDHVLLFLSSWGPNLSDLVVYLSLYYRSVYENP